MPINQRELKRFKDKIRRLHKGKSNEILKKITCEMGARYLRLVTKLTPVGVYKEKTGGQLRAAWRINGEKQVTNDLPIKKNKGYYLTVTNSMKYASYVEYGHRTRLDPSNGATQGKKAWVEGRFMMTKTTAKIKNNTARIVDRVINKELKKAITDGS